MSGSKPQPVFSSDVAAGVLREACALIGEQHDDAELLRLGENAIFRLAGAPVVVRIARDMDRWADATKEVAVSSWLESSGVAAAQTWQVAQPIEVHGHPVTFWQNIDGRRGANRDVRELATVLRRLHSLPQPTDFSLESVSPIERVQRRIELAAVDDDDKAYLRRLAATLRSHLDELVFPLAACVTHGDAHVQNLMIVDGDPVLIDFERFGFGQPEWDLSVTATEYVTAKFWSAAEYTAFVDEYGFDVTDWAGFGVLRRIQELKMTTWLMQNVDEKPSIRAEFDRRMTVIREGRPSLAWHAF
ncbi:phosphotransferase family protein [Pseudonocardia sp. N23]|uniref:phosphotransferase family protein n=1 Tax=Pseudonocardia sp. N23 TaxID=1987376 RepID=UPI00114610A3|nr:aminoglycoside phosphotransferase family protein [Pseudonocardia sp. N23]